MNPLVLRYFKNDVEILQLRVKFGVALHFELYWKQENMAGINFLVLH